MSVAECPICAEFYTGGNRQHVCTYCQKPACRTCIYHWIFESLNDPTCMHCHKVWSRELMVTPAPSGIGLTKAWVNGDYKRHREEVLIERERANLPAAQLEIEKAGLRREELKRIEREMEGEMEQREELKAQLRQLRKQTPLPYQEIDRVMEEITRLMSRKAGYEQHLALVKEETWQPGMKLPDIVSMVTGELSVARALMNTGLTREEALAIAAETDVDADTAEPDTRPVDGTDAIHHPGEQTAKARFVRACPATNCRGFLSNRWKCGTCRVLVCKECWEIKGLVEDQPHECRPTDLAAVREIKENSRMCPACGVPVYRVSGCNTMFCMHCKTGFNYETRRIITSRTVGNPHYYEWRRQQAGGAGPHRPVDDGECCQALIPYDTVIASIRTLTGAVAANDVMTRLFGAIHEEVAHLEFGELPQLRQRPNNMDLNVRFLKKEVTEDVWKVQLQRREREAERNAAFSAVVEMVVGVAHDIFDRFRTQLTIQDLPKMVNEFLELEQYANAQLERVRRTYDSKYKLRVDWFDRNTEAGRIKNRTMFLAASNAIVQ